MKPALLKHFVLIVELILVSACTFPATEPTTPASEAPATQLVTVDLAGPEMKVGSKFLYADGTVLVAVPGGLFTMGANGPDNPQHQVNLSDFWIYSTKVTNAQYAYCVAMGLCQAPLHADDPGFYDSLETNDPVAGVSYDEATAYCSFVHGRLPTEAEWEKTTRGPDANIYPWGNGAPGCDLLNYGTCVGKTTPVNSYPTGKSYYQAFDMEGNTQEWVSDWYQADYYLNSPKDNPQGPANGQYRSIRSSAFNSGGDQTLASTRSYSSPDTHRSNLGFRCVVNDPTYFAPFCTYPAEYGTNGVGGEVSGPQSIIDCPAISITQDEECKDGQPITFVTFSGDKDMGYGVNAHGSCVPTDPNAPPFSHPDQWTCNGTGQLLICSGCNVTLLSPPQCPSGYQFNPDTKQCESHGATGGTCLTGFALQDGMQNQSQGTPTSTTSQCCAFTPVSPTTNVAQECHIDVDTNVPICEVKHDFCPPGSDFDGTECTSTNYGDQCKQESVALADCTVKGGDTPICPGVSCGLNYKLDPSTCSCVCNGC